MTTVLEKEVKDKIGSKSEDDLPPHGAQPDLPQSGDRDISKTVVWHLQSVRFFRFSVNRELEGEIA